MIRHRIYLGDYPLQHDTGELLLDTAATDVGDLTEAQLQKSIGKAGSMTIGMLRSHPRYNDAKLMNSAVEVWDGTTLIWGGRPMREHIDKTGKKIIECEGNLNYLIDIPDTMTNPPTIVKEYKIGSDAAAATLEFTDDGNGLYGHPWEPDEFGGLYQSEFGDVFFVKFDGELYELTLQLCEEYSGGTKLRIGYIGNMTIWDPNFAKTNDAGSSAPFYIQNSGIYTKNTEATHAVKIYRRKELDVTDMFHLMFSNDHTNYYNAWASAARKMYEGSCDVAGHMIYDPGIDTTSLDTLHAWQELFGGYIYTRYDVSEQKWKVHYTAASGRTRTDVPIKFGLNILDIETENAGNGLLTAIAGVGVDELTEEKFNLAGETLDPAITETAGFTRGTNSGYVEMDAAVAAYGKIRQQRQYTIPHDAENRNQTLYNQVISDLAAAIGTVKAMRITAFDARLLGVEAGIPEVGDMCMPEAPLFGAEGMYFVITDMTIDMINPGRSVMQLGRQQRTITGKI